jgi:hypothetical protein
MRSREEIFELIEATAMGQRDGMVQLMVLQVLIDLRDLLQAGEDRIARLEKMAEEHRRELQ